MSSTPASLDNNGRPAAPDYGAICTAAVNSAPDAVFFCDEAGICRMANPKCSEVFGVEPRDLVGHPIGRFFPPQAVCAALRQQEAVLADGIERGCELAWAEGIAYWLSHTVFSTAAGENAILIGRMRNIAAEKRLEKQIVEASERVMHRIACDLHDDLCQELAAASLIAKLLEKRLADTDKPQAKVAAHIADLTRQMAVKTRGIIHNLAPDSLSGDSFVASLRNVATHLCEAYPVKFGIEGRWPEALCAEGAAIQLYRIAHEAMHNAARHSGGDCITVRLHSSANEFILSISDNGHGISADNGGREGGLGLASMRYRAGLVGGELMIQSTPLVGTCVSCKVPLP